jgi:hypothetical protein
LFQVVKGFAPCLWLQAWVCTTHNELFLYHHRLWRLVSTPGGMSLPGFQHVVLCHSSM